MSGQRLRIFAVDNGNGHVDTMIVHGCIRTFCVQDFNSLFEMLTLICRDDSWLKEKLFFALTGEMRSGTGDNQNKMFVRV